MRAMRVHEFGDLDRLVLDETDRPDAPGAGEVLVEIDAAGVNFADILMVAGRYQMRPPLPFSPGFEVAGVVAEVGPGVDGFAVGSPVAGNPWFGAYAEAAVLPAAALLSRPAHIDAITAAAMTVTYGTAYHALLDRARLASGEILVVTGATGGVGSAAVGLGKILGATVVAAVGSHAKRDPALAAGADAVVVAGDPETGLREQIAAVVGGPGRIDVVLDVVGGPDFETLIRELGPGGRALAVGFTEGSIPAVPANILLLKEAAAIGVFWGAFREREHQKAQGQMDTIWRWVDDGTLSPPPIATYPLEAAADALASLQDRTLVGKAVLEVGRGRR